MGYELLPTVAGTQAIENVCHMSRGCSGLAFACRYGSLVRLLTEDPPKLAEADLIRMQRGQCAGCRAPLPSPAKPSGFLGSRSATMVRCCTFVALHCKAELAPDWSQECLQSRFMPCMMSTAHFFTIDCPDIWI